MKKKKKGIPEGEIFSISWILHEVIFDKFFLFEISIDCKITDDLNKRYEDKSTAKGIIYII